MTLNFLKKIIKYRATYSGKKETDILYEKYFVRNLDNFSAKELQLLKSVFDNYTDDEIYLILKNTFKPEKKFAKLFDKIK